MPKTEEQPALGDPAEEVAVDAVIETLNLFASLEQDAQRSAEGAGAAAKEAKTLPDESPQ